MLKTNVILLYLLRMESFVGVESYEQVNYHVVSK